MRKPLEDVRVIALEQYGAGPFGTLHLADLGAEIIKIEDPTTKGDVSRYIPPFQEDSHSLFFETFNRNKKSISLDIKTQRGREVFHDLIKVSDVVFSNFRGDVPEKLNLTYEHLGKINKSIVCVSLSSFGMTGSRKNQPGYDYIMQAISGWMDLTGDPDGPPTKSGLSLVDYSGGLAAAISILAGLHSARLSGEGMDCDLSLFDTAISMLTYPATWMLTKNHVTQRTKDSAHPSVVPFQIFKTSNGWISVVCAKEKFWKLLVEELEDPRLENPNFHDFESRYNNKEALAGILSEIFIQESSEHWDSRLQKKKIPCGIVNSLEEALEDTQVKDRNMIMEIDHPIFGSVKEVRTSTHVGDSRNHDHKRAPFLNENKEYVLNELLNYKSEKIKDLEEGGAFG
jgi:crotonobetainyl-CoA:carnitine CoA-transferase CaiB-like acyl-CoA transferase